MHSALRRAASLPSIVLAASFLATAHAQAAERCPATVVNRDSAGTRDSPLQLVSGCLNTVEFASADEELYVYLSRDDQNSVLIQEWDMEQPASTLFMYDWEQAPTTQVSGARFMWYFLPATAEGDTTWRRDTDCRGAATDCYHCTGNRCGGSPHPESNTGPLYITLSNQPASTSAYGGEVKFVLQPPRTLLTDEAKFAVQSLWMACCEPTYYRRDEADTAAWAFDPAEWEDENGSDPDRVPYCYWNPLGAHGAQHITGNPLPAGLEGPVQGWSAVTDESCEDLNHVQCDERGNIAELSLSGLGLKCDQIPNLPGLSRIKNFHAGANMISGTVPIVFTTSSTLEEFKMTHNFLTGTVPCFASSDLDALHLDFNFLTGTIPACLLGKPSMEQLHLSTNYLAGSLPARWGVNSGETSNMVSLQIKNTNLQGPLPGDMSVLPRIAVIDLSQNHLTGPIPESILQVPATLYKLALSHNDLSGTLPQVGRDMQSLKILQLDNNHIYGAVSNQFDYMRQYQVDEVLSSISLQGNSFSGALPRVVSTLTLSEPYIRQFDISDNHFYCEKSTGTWPAWAMRLDSKAKIGTCEPVPRIDRIEPPEMAVGEPITVFGSGFMATDDFRCKFGDAVSDALFDSTTQARCIVPAIPGVSPGQTVVLTMANYGEDWSSPELLRDYSPTSFTLSTSETCSGHGTAQADGTCDCDSDASGQWSGQHCDEKSTNPFLKALVFVLVFVAIGFGVFIWVLISKEKKGDPLFMSLLEGTDNAMGGDGKENFAMGGMTVEGAEPHMPPPPPESAPIGSGSVTEL